MPFPGTIMASGNSDKVFPDGSRCFTRRELARCQTLSDSHILGKIGVERASMLILMCLIVVGNAVPPLLARRLMEAVVAKLKETDAQSAV
jgi:site-specific DNA-cytosine methylase